MKCEVSNPLGKILFDIARGIARHPNEMQAIEERHDNFYGLTILPYQSDYPILVGKSGRQVNAFRYLMDVWGRRNDMVAVFNLQESYGGRERETFPLKENGGPSFEVAEKVIGPLCFELTGQHTRFRFDSYGGATIVWVDIKSDSIIAAIGDVLYPYFKGKGGKLKVKKL